MIVQTWIKLSKFGQVLSKTVENCSNCQNLFETVQFFKYSEPRTISIVFCKGHKSKTFYMSDFVTFGTYFLWKINYIVGFYVPRNNLKLRVIYYTTSMVSKTCKITTIKVDNLIFAVRRSILAHVVYHTLDTVPMDILDICTKV